MKRFPILVLCLIILAFALSGCGRADMAKSEANTPEEYYATDEEAYEASAEAPEEMYDNGGISGGSAAAPAPDEKIIYSMSADVETQKFDETIEYVYALIARCGGFIENSSVSGADYASKHYGYRVSRSANFTVRVPSQRYRELQDGLPALGNVLNKNEYTENITAQFRDNEARMKAYETEETRLLELLEKAESIEDILVIESRLSEVRYNIEAIKTTLNAWQNQVDYSTVSLYISEVEEFTDEVPVTLSYGQQIGNAFKNALKGIGRFFKDAGILLVGALPVLVIIAVVFAVVIVIIKAKRKKKAKAKQIASGDTEKDKE